MTVVERPADLHAEHTDPSRRRWKWTGDDLIRMGSAGLLPVDTRFELMDGEIFEIMPPSPFHAWLVRFIMKLFIRLLDDSRFQVLDEKPIRLNEHYAPEPDIAVVRGDEQAYRDRFPDPADVVVAIEVADTSLSYDRREKLAAYAAAGIPEYWIVNVRDGQVEVYREPSGPEYLLRRICKPGESLSPTGVPEIAVPVATLLGR